MIRAVELLLIACFCACVSSSQDCIFEAIQVMRGRKSIKVRVEEAPTAPRPTIRTIRDGDERLTTQHPTITSIRDGDEPPTTPLPTIGDDNDGQLDNLGNFEQLYLDLKQHYDTKLRELEIENDLLRKMHSNMQIQTFCTCNITDRPTTNDCNSLKTNVCLDKLQEIQSQLSNITEKMEGIDSINGRSCVRSVVESQNGENFIDWKKLPGAAVDISAKGKELWAIGSANKVYRWDGSNWELKPGVDAVRVGSSPDGWTWVINKSNNIYRWNVDKSNWDLMPGGLMQISAMSKDIALGVNSGHAIYLWSNNAWKQLPGAATWAGIGYGDERWVVNSQQNIYRWNHQVNTWNQMPGAAVNVDVQNPCRVIVTNASNQIFIWRNNNWQMINGAGTRSSIDGTHYYTVNSAQQIFIGN